MVQAAYFAEVAPVCRRERNAGRDVHDHFDGRIPSAVAPERRHGERYYRKRAERHDLETPMHAISKSEPEDAGRDDEPQHQRVEMPVAAYYERSDGQ